MQVREILRRSCVRIDAAQANAVGQWQDLDANGQIDYSRWYGAGRLDVDAAVALVLDSSLPLADTFVRENLSDAGDVPSSGAWWASPDIWVKQDATTPIPALAWSDPTPHENARRGQDNAVFCRVRNRGAAAAPAVYVRAMLTHWAGLEFVYPDDFQPSNNVGSPLPSPLVPGTYLIGQTRIDNLAAGDDEIVKFVWPQALIPPETVVVGSATVHWHPCLLVEASPHDGPAPVGGLSVPVQGNSNVAQRNIKIVNAGDSDADLFIGMIAGTRDAAGVDALIVDATRLRGATSIRLYADDERVMRQITTGIGRAVQEQHDPGQTGRKRRGCLLSIFRLFNLARWLSKTATTGSVQHHGLDAVEIKGLRGQIEIPVRLSGGQFVPILVAVTGPGSGDLHITQRRRDGELSAGYGISRISPS